jgi:delta1-piperideine-2-carboxylate reductase
MRQNPINSGGVPTTDPDEALAGAMLPFGGHKGSALSLMIELLAGPLIGDLTSLESMAFDDGDGATPMHGELLIALDPARFTGADRAAHAKRAETLLNSVEDQGARLPSKRRYEARRRTEASGMILIPRQLFDDIMALNQPVKTERACAAAECGFQRQRRLVGLVDQPLAFRS